MKFIKIFLLIYSIIFQLVFCLRDNLFESDFIDLYPTWIAATLYSEDKKDAVYANSIYGSERSKEWIYQENKIITSGAGETNFVYLPIYLFPFLIIQKLISYSIFKKIFLLLNIFIISFVLSDSVFKSNLNLLYKIIILSFILISDPIKDILLLGQNITFLYIFFHLYTTSVIKNYNFRAVIYLIIMIIIKPWSLVFGLLPIIYQKKKLILYHITGFISFITLNFIIEYDLMISFIKSFQANSNLNLLAQNNISFYSFFLRLFYLDSYNKYLLSSWQSIDISDTMHIKIFIFLIFIPILIYSYFSKNRLIKLSIYNYSPIILMNVFWNHYLFIYIKNLFKPPHLSKYMYLFLFLSLSISKQRVQYFLDYISVHIFKSQYLIELLVIFPLVYIVFKELIKINKIIRVKNQYFNLNLILQIFLFILLLYIFLIEKRLYNLKFNYIGFFILFSFIIIFINKALNYRYLFFYILSAFFITLTYYFSTIYYPDVGISKHKIYIQILYITLMLLFVYFLNKYKSIKIIFLFSILSSTTLINSFLYNSPGFKYSFLIIYLLIYILISKFRVSFYHFLFLVILISLNYLSFIKFNSIFGSTLPISILLLSIISSNDNIIKRRYFTTISFYIYVVQLVFFLIISEIYINSNTLNNSIYWLGFHINSLGGFFAIFISILFIRYNEDYQKNKFSFLKNNLTITALFILSLALLLITKSRSNIIALFLSILIVSYVIKNKSIFNFFFFSSSLLLTSLLVYLSYSYDLLNFDSIKARIVIIRYLIDMVLNNSLIIGFGLDNTTSFMNFPFSEYSTFFHEYLYTHGMNLHAHNLIFQVFYSLGIIGLILFLLTNILSISSIMKSNNNYTLFKNKLFIYTFVAIQTFFDFTFTDSFIIIFVSFFLFSFNDHFNFKNFYLSSNLTSTLILFLSLYIFINSFMTSKYYTLVEIVKPDISYSLNGSIYINETVKISDYNEVNSIQKSIYFNSVSNHPLKQLLGEVNYQKYLETNDKDYLDLSSRQLESCILDNYFEINCISSLIRNYSITNNFSRINELKSLLIKLDPNFLLQKFYNPSILIQ